jgi:hypothetical protein
MVHVSCLLGLTFSYIYGITAELSQTLASAHSARFDVPFDDDRRGCLRRKQSRCCTSEATL